MGILKEKRDHVMPVQMIGYESELRELVEEVKRDNIAVMGLDYGGEDGRPDTDELEENSDDHELEKYYR